MWTVRSMKEKSCSLSLYSLSFHPWRFPLSRLYKKRRQWRGRNQQGTCFLLFISTLSSNPPVSHLFCFKKEKKNNFQLPTSQTVGQDREKTGGWHWRMKWSDHLFFKNHHWFLRLNCFKVAVLRSSSGQFGFQGKRWRWCI